MAFGESWIVGVGWVEELANLAAACHDDYGPEATPIILTLGFVGVWPEELSVLRRSDLDLSIRELTVRFNLDASGQEKAPRNGRPRIAPYGRLRRMRSGRSRRRSTTTTRPTPRGRRLSKGTLHYLWRPVATAWRGGGARDIDLYDLRHAVATLSRARSDARPRSPSSSATPTAAAWFKRSTATPRRTGRATACA